MESFRLFLEVGTKSFDRMIYNVKSYYDGNLIPSVLLQIIYDYLTRVDNRMDAFQNLTKTPKFREHTLAYQKIKNDLDANLKRYNWISVENPAWIEWYRGGKRSVNKDEGKTYKRYITVSPEDMWTVLSNLTNLALQLDKIAVNSDKDLIGFKIAGVYSAFVTHTDNIVIHFYDANIKNEIDLAVKKFFSAIGKKEANRSDLGRTEFGVDGQGTSDSMLVSKQILRNIDHNKSYFKNAISTPKGQQDFKQMIDQIMNSASHR